MLCSSAIQECHSRWHQRLHLQCPRHVCAIGIQKAKRCRLACHLFETILHLLELGFVFPLEFGNTQAILICDFRLQNDLYFLRRHLLSIEWVHVVHEIIANDLELDLGCQVCLLID